MNWVEHDGARIAWRKDGEGAALVLVHGTGGDGESNWGPMLDRFTSEWTVIRPDYSGSGATTDDGRALTAEYLAAQILAAADAAGAKTFHLVGFSLGAAIAARIAADHPDRVRSLVLLAGFASAKDARLRLEFELWRDLIRTDRRAMARLILLTGFSPDALATFGAQGIDQAVEDMLESMDWEGMARQVELDFTIDVSDRITRIQAPTLVIGCTHDHMVAASHAKALAAVIRGARYTELPTGHLAPMEQPDALADMVVAFLRDRSGGGGRSLGDAPSWRGAEGLTTGLGVLALAAFGGRHVPARWDRRAALTASGLLVVAASLAATASRLRSP